MGSPVGFDGGWKMAAAVCPLLIPSPPPYVPNPATDIGPDVGWMFPFAWTFALTAAFSARTVKLAWVWRLVPTMTALRMKAGGSGWGAPPDASSR